MALKERHCGEAATFIVGAPGHTFEAAGEYFGSQSNL